MRNTEELQTIFKSLVHVALAAYRPSMRDCRFPFSLAFPLFRRELTWNEFIPRRGNKSFSLQFAHQENRFMKAKHQWNSATTSCLSERATLRARPREVNTMRSKPLIPGLLVSEVLPEDGMSTPPQICNGCKSMPLAIAGRMAQSVSHDLRTHLSAIYSNVESTSESRTTQSEREKLLQDVHAVIQDMTGMLDSLLLLAKTGQTLRPRWASLNKMVEHAACMVRAHPDARNVDLVIQDGESVASWMDGLHKTW
jgi:His Kinase A (phospho-acceptor) domain